MNSSNEILTNIPVRTDRSNKFRELIYGKCRIFKIIEMVSDPIDNRGLLIFWLYCQPQIEKELSDYGFMSFIDNSEFQKYY